MFKLLRYFSLTSFVAIALVIAGLTGVYRQREVAQLVALTEDHNVTLTRSLANAVWPRYVQYLTSEKDTDGDTLRKRPETEALHETFHVLSKDLPVLKIKIYTREGTTIFSSEPSQIGQNVMENVGFALAMSGKRASQLVHRDAFSAFSGEVFNRDIVESYIPIQENGDSVAVFELYTDVTERFRLIDEAVRLLLLGLLGAFGVLYGVLFLIVSRADHILKRQYADIKAKNEELGRLRNTALEASRAKSELLANMSHELRTPLNAIIGFSSTMMSQMFGPLSAKYVEYATDINRSGEHLLELINDILDVSAIEAGKVELSEARINILETVEAVLTLIRHRAEKEEVALRVHLADNLPDLWADRRRIKQILLNLLSNSVKFTPSGGEVTLSVTEEAGSVVVRVADTGVGMSPAELEIAMTEFGRVENSQSSQCEGTGLGLPLTEKLVKIHQGAFRIDSEKGRGTTVEVTFPTERTRV